MVSTKQVNSDEFEMFVWIVSVSIQSAYNRLQALKSTKRKEAVFIR